MNAPADLFLAMSSLNVDFVSEFFKTFELTEV